jgi:dienelactone hydrolase
LRAVFFLALLWLALVLLIVNRSWVEAQVRAVTVLSTTIETPVLTWFVKVVTGEPRVEETTIGGQRATLVRPEHGDRWPAIVFVNGATREGRHHPDVQRLARGFARAGYLVAVPDLPGLSLGRITDETVQATVGVADAIARRDDVRGHRVGFTSVSVGTTLALLAAEDERLADRVTLVAGIAPFTDLEKVIELATTGEYVGRPYDHDDYVQLAVARSLAAALPARPPERRLLRELEAIDDEMDDPLASLRREQPGGLGRAGRAVVALLLNRDPQRFARLFEALPARMRAAVRRLSPLLAASRLRAPVAIASAPHDKYFPVAESRALDRAAPDVDVAVTRTLSHAIPEPSPRDFIDLFRFDGFVVRALHDLG